MLLMEPLSGRMKLYCYKNSVGHDILVINTIITFGNLYTFVFYCYSVFLKVEMLVTYL